MVIFYLYLLHAEAIVVMVTSSWLSPHTLHIHLLLSWWYVPLIYSMQKQLLSWWQTFGCYHTLYTFTLCCHGDMFLSFIPWWNNCCHGDKLLVVTTHSTYWHYVVMERGCTLFVARAPCHNHCHVYILLVVMAPSTVNRTSHQNVCTWPLELTPVKNEIQNCKSQNNLNVHNTTYLAWI